MKTTSCRHETLARNGAVHVQTCSHCGGLSVHVGPVTVRFNEASFEALREAVNEAARRLTERDELKLPAAQPRGLS